MLRSKSGKAWIAFAVVMAIFGMSSAASADTMTDAPGTQKVVLPLVTPEEAETLAAARDRAVSETSASGIKAGGTVAAASATAPSAPIPSSVAELARALKYDPVLIYEFVRNNIDYLPLWGTLKGSEGTLTDGLGTAFDIAQLTADLINTNPASGTSATLVRGVISLPSTTAASWLSLNAMNGCPLAYTMAQGDIPVGTLPANCAGPFNLTVSHVWVQVTIGGVKYEIDPSFKTHTAITTSVDLPTVTGYSRSAFLGAACGGSCNTNPNIVTTLNRSGILNSANTHSYPAYARNLLAYLQQNNIHDLNKVIGGYRIDSIYSESLPTSLPYIVLGKYCPGSPPTYQPLPSTCTFSISNSWKTSVIVSAGKAKQLFYSDTIYGKRLSITFDASNFAQLNLDGAVVQTGTVANPTSVKLSICRPFSGANCVNNAVHGDGSAIFCGSTGTICVSSKIVPGGTYAITNSWGPVGHNMVERHRLASILATNAGIAPTAEANLGEVLTTQGLSYSEQSGLYLSLSEDGMRNGGFQRFVVGVSGHTGTTGGPYIDLPAVSLISVFNTALNSDGTYTPSTRDSNFFDATTQDSAFESTSVYQVSGVPSVSTVKLVDIGISQATNNNIYDLRSSADYTTYGPSLVGYTAADKTAIQNLLAQNNRVILPQRGDLTDPAITTTPKWTGVGYYVFPNTVAGGAYSTTISGDYQGGYSGRWQPPASTVSFSRLANISSNFVTTRSPAASPSSSSWSGMARAAVNTASRFISDPVDQVTGAFVNSADDISIGEVGSARELAFTRSYSSADLSQASQLGQGWKHNLDIWAQNTSDGARAAGAYDAWDAAEMLVAKMVNSDLLSDPALPVVNVAVSAIGNSWLGGRLVDNVVTVNTGDSAISFHRLADDTYNPSQHSTARLSGSPSAWAVAMADGTLFSFNAADTTGLAKVGTIAVPSGIKNTFDYTNPAQTVVSNNLGRRLNLNWTGDKITSVTDSPILGATARTVSFSYSGNLLQQVTNTRGGRTLYCYDSNNRMISYYLPSEGSGTSCAASGAHIANVFDTLGRVKQQTDGGSHVTDLYLAGTRSETVTHPGSGVADIRAIRYMDNFGNVTRDISPRTGLPVLYTYDALSRLVRTDWPEGNAVETAYDIRSNPTLNCMIAKTAGAYPACNTGGGSTNIWTTTAYGEGTSVWNCVAINTCNQPVSDTDPLGNVTTFTYYTDGQINTVTAPTPAGYAGVPKSIYSYTATASLSGSINLLTGLQQTATAGSPPSIVTTFSYDTAANGLALQSKTLDPSGLNYTSSFGYDGYGNQTTVRGPRTDLNDTVTTAYNADRQPTTITYPDPGTGSPITQITYDADGRVTSTARKLGSSWMVSCSTYTPSGQVSSSFGPYKTSSATDCSFDSNTAVPKVTSGYDGADRLITNTVAEPSGNRILKLGLFPDNSVQTQTSAFGTTVAAIETVAYSNNGQPTLVTDARGNVTSMAYDGFDRLTVMGYPLASGGGASTTDVVAFAYDKRGAVTKRSIRGTSDVSSSCSQCLAFTYDALGRLTLKGVPAMAANASVIPNILAVPGYSVYFHYDLIGRLDSQGYNSGSPELSFVYDNAGRLTSSTQYGRTVGYSYGTPAQGLSRTLTWPSSAGSVLACTDALGRVSQIKEASDCATTTGRLVVYGYDDLSRRTSVARANGANSTYAYEDTGALDTLSHAITGGAVNYAFNYNRALQVTSRSTDNDLYAWTKNYNVTRAYTANGLDQYGRIMGDTPAWDTRGNLTSYRGTSYAYDGENRLAAVAMIAGTATTGYDPAARLRQIGTYTTKQLLYDGDAPIAEYDAASGAIVNRFVPGPGTDETIVAYDAAGAKSWYHADAQGSVVATSDAGGALAVVNQYGPNGEPGLIFQGRNQGRLTYTGQIALPELAPTGGPSQPLMSFKARIYLPKLGRFLQTDPIGAADGSNLYAYVGNDPVNLSDPSGLAAESVYKKTIGPGTRYDTQVVKPFYARLNQLANSPLGDPGVGLSIEQSSPYGVLPGAALYGVARTLRASNTLANWARAGEVASVSRAARIATDLEQLGGGVPKFVPTPKGASQFIFPNRTVLRFDIAPGQYLSKQGPHINLEVPGNQPPNIHIDLKNK